MRNKLGNAVRKDFDVLLRKKLPNFQLDKTAVVPPGCPVYLYQVAPDLKLFLYLMVSPNYEEFTVEVGWTRGGSLPHSFTGTGLEVDYNVAEHMEALFRIGNLWNPKKDFWWIIEPRLTLEELTLKLQAFDMSETPIEDLLPNVSPLVEDAMNRIIEYAVPYFKQIARLCGHEHVLSLESKS